MCPSPKTEMDSARHYWVAWVEPTTAPQGAEGNNWYRYALECQQSVLMGWRQGSLQEVTEHALQYTEELNARSRGEASSWPRRRK